MATRTENDAFWDFQVPSDESWRAQTEPSLENSRINQALKISNYGMPLETFHVIFAANPKLRSTTPTDNDAFGEKPGPSDKYWGPQY
ncbi:hypothetical protein MMC29_006760 [Sticta canariensis]|nr:hypothetical protein [Sticta canariensis]